MGEKLPLPSLKFESTINYALDSELDKNEVIKQILSELTPSEQRRLTEVFQHLGHVFFNLGNQRPPVAMNESQQFAVMHRDLDLFLKGASEYSDYLDGLHNDQENEGDI